MKRKGLLLVSLLLVATLGNTHEFWLQPKKYRYKVGEEARIDFMVGENFRGEFWDLGRHRVEKLEVISAYGRKDLTKAVKATKGNNLSWKLATDGAHMFVLQSNTAFIEMDGAKFNAYLEEDGLDYILEGRRERNEMDKPSKENYTRYAKLLLQAGNWPDEVYKRKVGLRLEIIPSANPYTLKSGDYLECKVLYEGQPGAHQMVKVWNTIGNRTFLQNIFTENDGTIKFPISNSGPWMVSTVKMMSSEKEGIDYESMWASLVFGIE